MKWCTCNTRSYVKKSDKITTLVLLLWSATVVDWLNQLDNTGSFKIIVGVSLAYNFQTVSNKIKLFMEYESVTQKVLLRTE
jgi:hypothetical protein